MHRDKKSRIYHIKILILWKKQKFSSTSFPHVFKAIGPLESNLETKNHFFITFKKVTFSVCRILNAKTKKVRCFWSIFSILILYGENQHSQKLPFYNVYIQLRLTFFIENIVSLCYCDYQFCSFSACYRLSNFDVLKP